MRQAGVNACGGQRVRGTGPALECAIFAYGTERGREHVNIEMATTTAGSWWRARNSDRGQHAGRASKTLRAFVTLSRCATS